jgi:hypothetical protein
MTMLQELQGWTVRSGKLPPTSTVKVDTRFLHWQPDETRHIMDFRVMHFYSGPVGRGAASWAALRQRMYSGWFEEGPGSMTLSMHSELARCTDLELRRHWLQLWYSNVTNWADDGERCTEVHDILRRIISNLERFWPMFGCVANA